MRPTTRVGTASALLACLAVLPGCGTETPAGGGAGGRPTVAIVYGTSRASFAAEMAKGFHAGAEDAGDVEVRSTAPPIVDGPRQVQLLKDVAGTARGGITVQAISSDLLSRPLAGLVKEGVPVIAIDSPPPPASQVELYVANDNYELGQLLADELIGHLPPAAAGAVVVGSPAPGAVPLDQRVKGMRDRLRAARPGIRVLGTFATDREQEANLGVWRNLVRAHPTALAFVGIGDMDTINLGRLHRGAKARWLACGFDIAPQALKAVRDGDLIALASPEHYLKGAVAGRIQADHAKSRDPLPKGWIYTPGLLITAGNIDEIIRRQGSDATRQAWFTPKTTEIVTNLDRYLRPLKGSMGR